MTFVGVSSEDLVLVAGATGGVGQLVVGKLLEKGFKVRILTHNAAKAQQMFNDRVEISVGDMRDLNTLPAAMQDVTYIICCAGTTAFPSERWEFEPTPNFIEWGQIFLDSEFRDSRAKNSPAKVDAQGVSNLVAASPRNLKRFVFISSCGIERKDKFPFKILNSFGVLDAKQKGEGAIINSGFPYTIIRPGRLIDGPYTSYDLNTLMKAKTGGQLGVVVGTGDTLLADTSRIDLAIACVECLFYSSCSGQVFELANQGTRPPIIDWKELFSEVAKTDV
jgi:uncharacterized protein YbjT (DUF2867 family)